MLRDFLILALVVGVGVLVEKRVRNVEADIKRDRTKDKTDLETERKIEALRESSATMHNKVEVLQDMQDDLNKQLLQAKSELKVALNSEKEMSARISKIGNELDQSEKLRSQLQSKLSAIEKDCKEEQNSRKSVKDNIDRLEKELHDSKSKDDEVKGKVKSIENELGEVQSTNKILDDRMKSLVDVLKDVKNSGNDMNNKIVTLQKDITDTNTAGDELKNSVETLKKGRPVVAFHVVGTDQTQLGDSQLLAYSKIVTNIGNGYDKGYFVAPVKGLYLLSLSAMSPKGKQLRVEMVKNGEHIADAFSGSAGEEMGSQTATVVLQAGDKAWVRHHPSQKQKGHIQSDTLNSFSGFLISTDV